MFVSDPESKKFYGLSIFAKNLQDAIDRGLPSLDSRLGGCRNAYSILHNELDKAYLPMPAVNTIRLVRETQAWLNGYSTLQQNSALLQNFSRLKGLISAFPDGTIQESEFYLSKDFLVSQIIKPVLSQVESITGGQFLVWRLYPYMTSGGSKSYSLNWHYDVHVQQDFPYAMFFFCDELDLANGGTMILDATRSSAISNQTGYISSPITQRISSLSEVSSELTDQDAELVIAGRGNGIIFWPSRSLHKGVLPEPGKNRYALHFSFLPVDNARSLEERACDSFDLCALQIATQESFLPYYANPPQDLRSPIVWDGSIQSEQDEILLASSIFSPHSIPQNCLGLHKKYNISNVNQYLAKCMEILTTSNRWSAVSLLRSYAESVNLDSSRFSSPPREHVFWPNPEHPKYPLSIHEIEPHVSSYPIITKSTRVASAGSCFAVEISEYFQKNGFNYIVEEVPLTVNDGVQVDGFTPGVSKYVRFSANYGIYFNSLSLLQMAQRAFGRAEFKRIVLPFNDFYVDPYRELIYFKSPEAYRDDYDAHTNSLQRVLSTCDTFIFTLGLNECWRFRDDETVMSRNPWNNSLYPLIRHCTLTVDDHVKAISEFFTIVKTYNPSFKLILSLSPIAFLATGRAATHHVIEANTHSKAVQRVAAEILCSQEKDIYYFPSYEYVTECLVDPWLPDGRHLKPSAVNQVMRFFERMFTST